MTWSALSISPYSLEGCLFFAGGDAWVMNSQRGIALAQHVANCDEIVAEDWIER
jgi:hypothetical protein